MDGLTETASFSFNSEFLIGLVQGGRYYDSWNGHLLYGAFMADFRLASEYYTSEELKSM